MSGKFLSMGSDYELFLRDPVTNHPVSAIPIVQGDKENKLVLPGCEIHHDNVLLEVNTVPAYSAYEWKMNVDLSLAAITNFLHPQGYTYSIIDNAVMPKKELMHHMAMEFGCEEDYDIFSGLKGIPPTAIEADTLRTAGGHIHVGFKADTHLEFTSICTALSLVLSLGTTVMGDSQVRRTLYGQAGRIRVKPYGVEIRSPSNVWLKYESWRHWMWNAASKSIKDASHIASHVGDACGIINNCDKEGAISALKCLGIDPPSRKTLSTTNDTLMGLDLMDGYAQKNLKHKFKVLYDPEGGYVTDTPNQHKTAYHTFDTVESLEEDEDETVE